MYKARHKKSSLLVQAEELRTMYNDIVSHAVVAVNDMTYRPKHIHKIAWDATMHESERLVFAVITGLMLGVFLFFSFID